MSNKKEIFVEALEKEIIGFLTERATRSGGKHTSPGCNLKHGQACVLATSNENVPRVTPVDFFCDGTMNMWINGEPGGKIANIMRNPKVAVGLHEPVNHSVEQKSMQLWGKAQLINEKNNADLVNEKWKEFGLDEAAEGMFDKMILNNVIPKSAREKTMEMVMKKINLIKIIPEKIVLLQMTPDRSPIKKI
jgi:nitroimidazol reductase NimA-like FMN-containing flavoprotein (pyridoxamine 5'-phosphate oxidase superfamily)